jgi:thiol-disulfide isomerase/thioredoxin
VRWLICLLLTGCGRDQAPPPPSASVVNPEPRSGHAGRSHGSSLRDVTVTTATGTTEPLAAHMRDVTLLVFWASWCGPCKMEMPLVDRYAASEQDAHVAVIGVNIDETREDGVAAVAARGLKLPVVYDPDEETYAAVFHTQDAQIPALAIVSRDGVETEVGFDDSLSDDEHVAHLRSVAHAHLHP